MNRNTVVAIYTCARHEYLHPEFYRSAIGRTLSERFNARFIEVFADPGESASCLADSRLTVATEEAYANLCRKTLGMISVLVEHAGFDFLIKVDVTAAIPAMNQVPQIRNRVADPAVLVDFLDRLAVRIDSGQAAQYEGWKAIRPSRQGIERWADIKGLDIDVPAVFGQGPIPPYYSGKCYVLGWRFAEYVADNGRTLLNTYEQHLPSEDLLVGHLFQRFMGCPLQSPCWPPPTGAESP